MTATALKLAADGAVTLVEAMRILSLRRTTLYGLMKDGTLPHVKVGRRVLIPRKALVELLARNMVGQN